MRRALPLASACALAALAALMLSGRPAPSRAVMYGEVVRDGSMLYQVRVSLAIHKCVLPLPCTELDCAALGEVRFAGCQHRTDVLLGLLSALYVCRCWVRCSAAQICAGWLYACGVGIPIARRSAHGKGART